MDKNYYVYLVKCRDSSFYCGYTDDVQKRINAHNSGRGAKYTRSRGPVELVYCEKFSHKSDAMRRECEIKKLTHTQKKCLAEDGCTKGKECTNE